MKNIYYLAAKYLNWGALGCQPEGKWNSQWEVAHRIRKFLKEIYVLWIRAT